MPIQQPDVQLQKTPQHRNTNKIIGLNWCLIAFMVVMAVVTTIIIIVVVVITMCIYVFIYLFTNSTAYNPNTRSPQRQKGASKLENKQRKNSESVKAAGTC